MQIALYGQDLVFLKSMSNSSSAFLSVRLLPESIDRKALTEIGIIGHMRLSSLPSYHWRLE